MNLNGMTLIVRTTARLLIGIIVVFAVYMGMTGHLGPGGGFAGGVILAATAVLIVLAFGRSAIHGIVTEGTFHLADAGGALAFLAVGVCGWLSGSFFVNYLPRGELYSLYSGGTIVLSNVAILIKVAAGLGGAFLSLTAFRLWTETSDPAAGLTRGDIREAR